MFLTEEQQKKWEPVINHEDVTPIGSNYRKAVTACLLENTEKFLKEDAHANNAGGPLGSNPTTDSIAGYDPILISLLRRAMPNLIAYDLCGVQPMTGPTGLIFAMKSKYGSQDGPEALHNEALTDYTGLFPEVDDPQSTDPVLSVNPDHVGYKAGTNINDVVGRGMGVDAAERLGMGGSGDGDFNEMAFSVEKVTVTAKTRALKAEYTTELAQDLKAIHGLSAEAELANILSAEILAEINREIVRKINITAKLGCETGTTNAGVFDLDTDSNGRWSVEKFKGLLFQIERECNKIAKQTRRGKGNFILCSSDVASALSMAGVLNYNEALNGTQNFAVDDTGNTFVGTLNGRIKVYIDPYFDSGVNAWEYCNVGYRGTNPYDAGIFYCPYVPLQMVRAIGENSFQPKIAFKTRYGLGVNPFIKNTQDVDPVGRRENSYYRIFRIDNLM